MKIVFTELKEKILQLKYDEYETKFSKITLDYRFQVYIILYF